MPDDSPDHPSIRQRSDANTAGNGGVFSLTHATHAGRCLHHHDYNRAAVGHEDAEDIYHAGRRLPAAYLVLVAAAFVLFLWGLVDFGAWLSSRFGVEQVQPLTPSDGAFKAAYCGRLLAAGIAAFLFRGAFGQDRVSRLRLAAGVAALVLASPVTMIILHALLPALRL